MSYLPRLDVPLMPNGAIDIDWRSGAALRADQMEAESSYGACWVGAHCG